MASKGVNVVAFDFSPESVRVAREMARINGFEDRIQVDLMDVRDLEYPDDSFDLVTGEHALHHLIKFDGSLENLYRVLKPGSRAFFWENVTFDPLIRLLRPINWAVKGYVGEHSLGKEDLAYIDRVFDSYRLSHHSVFSTYSRLLQRPNAICRKTTRMLRGLDDFLLPRIPFLKRFYSLAFLEMRKNPKTDTL